MALDLFSNVTQWNGTVQCSVWSWWWPFFFMRSGSFFLGLLAEVRMQPINRNSFFFLEPLLKETILDRLIKIPLLIDFVCCWTSCSKTFYFTHIKTSSLPIIYSSWPMATPPGRDLYRATSIVTRELGFCGLIR